MWSSPRVTYLPVRRWGPWWSRCLRIPPSPSADRPRLHSAPSRSPLLQHTRLIPSSVTNSSGEVLRSVGEVLRPVGLRQNRTHGSASFVAASRMLIVTQSPWLEARIRNTVFGRCRGKFSSVLHWNCDQFSSRVHSLVTNVCLAITIQHEPTRISAAALSEPPVANSLNWCN